LHPQEKTGKNPIGEGVPIRPYGTYPEPKPVVVNCVAPEAVPCVFLAEPTKNQQSGDVLLFRWGIGEELPTT